MSTDFKSYQNTEEVVTDLNKYFKTVILEKYPDIMFEVCLERAFLKESKNSNLGKQKISDNARKRIIDYTIKELHSYYGEWVNLYNLDRKFRGHANFQTVYKTEFGRLYGNQPGTFLDHLFYTAHSFEKFKERYNEECFKNLKLAFQRILCTNPNPADYLRVLTHNAYEYCETDYFIYVNLSYGVLVIEKITNVLLIVKTFLTPDMDYPRENWYSVYYPASMLTGIRKEILENHPPEKIEKISIADEEIPFSLSHEMVSILKEHPELGY
jgi:hypothetical protein